MGSRRDYGRAYTPSFPSTSLELRSACIPVAVIYPACFASKVARQPGAVRALQAHDHLGCDLEAFARLLKASPEMLKIDQIRARLRVSSIAAERDTPRRRRIIPATLHW